LQLDIEAFKLFDVIISNFGLTMREVLDMISLLIYPTMEVGGMGDLFLPNILAQG
jgi:hypothetical protein